MKASCFSVLINTPTVPDKMETKDTLSVPTFFALFRDVQVVPYIPFVPVIFQVLISQMALALHLTDYRNLYCYVAALASASHGGKHPAAAMRVL